MTTCLRPTRARRSHSLSQPALPSWAGSLTARERDVLRAVARGLSTQEIATELFISSATVKTHVARLLSKIDARDRLQLAVAAWSSGFMT